MSRGWVVPSAGDTARLRRCRVCGEYRAMFLLRWLPGGKYECLEHPDTRPTRCELRDRHRPATSRQSSGKRPQRRAAPAKVAHIEAAPRIPSTVRPSVARKAPLGVYRPRPGDGWVASLTSKQQAAILRRMNGGR